MLSAFAAPLGLVCPAGRAPPGFLSTRCLVTGCSSGVFLLAVPLGRQSGLCSSSSRSGSLQASGLDRGGGGGLSLLPLDLRGSGVGTVSFRPFSDGCLSLHWQAWRDRGPEPWVAVVLRFFFFCVFLPNFAIFALVSDYLGMFCFLPRLPLLGCLCSACLFSSLVTCLVGQDCSPPALLTPVVFPLGGFFL